MIRFTYISFILFLALTSCKKDKIAPLQNEDPGCDCTPIPALSGPNTGYDYINDSVYTFFPQFNPNNDNEILYCSITETGEIDMVRMDLTTKQKTSLYTGIMNYAPSWRGNSILFDKGDGQIWIMDDNGGNDHIVTSGGLFYHPKWNSDGTKFMSYHGFVNNSTHFNGKVWNSSGILLDSLDIVPTNGDWSFGDNFAYVSGGNIVITNSTNGEQLAQFDGDYNKPYLGFNWISETAGIATNVDGFFKIDVFSGDIEQLKCSCDSRVYSQGCANLDGSKVMFTETVYSPINANTLRVRKNLVVMGADGSGFEIVELD